MWAFLMTSGNLLEVSSVKVFPKEREQAQLAVGVE